MTHWLVVTPLVTPEHGTAFFVNACLADGGTRTEVPKKITCKKCRELFEHPKSANMAASKLLSQVIAIQEEDRYHHVEVRCDSCSLDLDVSNSMYDPLDESITRYAEFLRHVAYDHMGGGSVLLSRVEEYASAYDNNYSVGKPASTQHEVSYRESKNLPPVFPVFGDIGRLSAEARVADES